jgi:hypothetical protein
MAQQVLTENKNAAFSLVFAIEQLSAVKELHPARVNHKRISEDERRDVEPS